MNIHIASQFPPQQLLSIESHFGAKYVCDTCLKNRDGRWINMPFSIFYQETPHPRGSNYFGLYFKPLFTQEPDQAPALFITNGISATEPFEGIVVGDTVYYSRFRHDCFMANAQVGIDGGRDYTRLLYDTEMPKVVKLQIQKDKLIVVGE